MEGDEEEDTEVVLKNSELYKHLLNCNNSEFEVYDTDDCFVNAKQPSSSIIRTPVTKVPTELLTYLDAILNSNILLDEDVAYLYGYTVDLISDLKVRKCWCLIFCGVLGLCSANSFIRHNSLLGIDDFIKSYSTLKHYYDKWQRTRLLLNLISIVKETHLYFKKTSQILYEQNAYFRLHELKSKSNGQTNEFDVLEKKKKMEVETLSSILGQCIVDNVLRTKEATMCLIEKLPLIHPIDSKNHYLAFMSDTQLGLQEYTTKQAHDQSFDVLKNIYLLMQSEFFRRLGLSFCPPIWSSKSSTIRLPLVFNVIQNYHKSCQDILYLIKFYYRKHVFPEKLVKDRSKDSVLIAGYSAVHKVSISLTELVTDSRILEEYVENLKKVDDSEVNSIANHLEELRKGLDSCKESVVYAEKYFSKLRRHNEPKKEEEEEVEDKENVESSQALSFEVGNINQSVASKDHVYFAITEGKIDKDIHDESGDFEPIKFPNYLLTELKQALEPKRNEFTDREIKAVENKDEYQKFLNTPEIHPKQTTKYKHEPFEENLPTCDFQMQKILASAVAQRSVSFMNHKEEQFGSSDESDSS